MCRFLAYLGDTIFLEELVCKPQHSLVRQSLRADQAKAVTNGDGFGIGWYGERETPGVYREVMPAWSDENLLALCANVRSNLFFAHVRAATGTGIARQNCHPFHYGPTSSCTTARSAAMARSAAPWRRACPIICMPRRLGATDSELLFLLIIARMETGEGVAEAVSQVLRETMAMMQVLHIHEPLRFAAALADGEQVYAFRFASDKRAPTLYMRQEGEQSLVVASEPLADDQQGWELIPQGMVLRLSREGFSRLTLD